MKQKLVYILIAVVAIATIGYKKWGTGTYDPAKKVVTVSSEDVEMNLAIKRAKSEIQEFRKLIADPTITTFSVKVPVHDKDQTEHFWLDNTEVTSDGFKGLIGNNAEFVTNVKYGQPITVRNEEISDWYYVKDGVMKGNYTLKVMFKSMPKDEADNIRKRLNLQ